MTKTTKQEKSTPIENNQKLLEDILTRISDKPLEKPKASNRKENYARMTLERLATILNVQDIFDLSSYIQLPNDPQAAGSTGEILSYLQRAGFVFTQDSRPAAKHSLVDFFIDTTETINEDILRNMITHHLMVNHGKTEVSEEVFADAVGWSVLRAAFMHGDTECFFDSMDSSECRNMSVIVTTRPHGDNLVNHYVYPLTGNFDSATETLVNAGIPSSAVFSESRRAKETQISIARTDSIGGTEYVTAPVKTYEIEKPLEYALFLHWSHTTQTIKVPSVSERLALISTLHSAFAE